MTNEKAIEILTYMKNAYGKEPNQALDLAIKALEFIDENYPKTFIDYLNGEQI